MEMQQLQWPCVILFIDARRPAKTSKQGSATITDDRDEMDGRQEVIIYLHPTNTNPPNPPSPGSGVS
jgi:hypothetical protein